MIYLHNVLFGRAHLVLGKWAGLLNTSQVQWERHHARRALIGWTGSVCGMLVFGFGEVDLKAESEQHYYKQIITPDGNASVFLIKWKRALFLKRTCFALVVRRWVRHVYIVIIYICPERAMWRALASFTHTCFTYNLPQHALKSFKCLPISLYLSHFKIVVNSALKSCFLSSQYLVICSLPMFIDWY